MLKWVKKVCQPIKALVIPEEGSVVVDRNLWSNDLQEHAYGQFSIAVVQANLLLEDQSQVEVRRNATFVGVYDGHGGDDVSLYVNRNLFNNILNVSQGNQSISEENVRRAFEITEANFTRHAMDIRPVVEEIYSMGTCCLVALIQQNRKLIIGNLGDSRAVLGRTGMSPSAVAIVPDQLTEDHNVSEKAVREDLKNRFPNVTDIVLHVHGAWRVKGIIQVSRSIGDLFLKGDAFAKDHPRVGHIEKPFVRSDPDVRHFDIGSNYRFLILASDGLWEHMSNDDVVRFVANRPRSGIAKLLIKKAQKRAAKKVRRKYNAVKAIEAGLRRPIHDDITVVVIFFDQDRLSNGVAVEEVSVKGFISDVPGQAGCSGQKSDPNQASTSGQAGDSGKGKEVIGSGEATTSGQPESSGHAGGSGLGSGQEGGSGQAGGSGSGQESGSGQASVSEKQKGKQVMQEAE